MLSNQINVSQNFNPATFKQAKNQTAVQTPLKSPEKDSFVAKNEIEPPPISNA